MSRPLARTAEVMVPGELDSSALKLSVAFTGQLACMSRAEAFEVVRQHGGTPSQAVTKRTNLLIVGELGWPLLDDGRPSNKLARATSYSIPVISERRFLEWIGKAVPNEVHKTYSGKQLAALSKLPSTTIQELVQFGLLDERGGRFGFRDLASARQIAKLLTDGVRLSEIVRGVSEIGNGCLRSGYRMCGSVPGLTTASKSNNRRDEPTNAANFSLRSMGLNKVPMTYSLEHSRLRKWGILQKPSGSTAC